MGHFVTKNFPPPYNVNMGVDQFTWGDLVLLGMLHFNISDFFGSERIVY